jgi:hypothetical protein
MAVMPAAQPAGAQTSSIVIPRLLPQKISIWWRARIRTAQGVNIIAGTVYTAFSPLETNTSYRWSVTAHLTRSRTRGCPRPASGSTSRTSPTCASTSSTSAAITSRELRRAAGWGRPSRPAATAGQPWAATAAATTGSRGTAATTPGVPCRPECISCGSWGWDHYDEKAALQGKVAKSDGTNGEERRVRGDLAKSDA